MSRDREPCINGGNTHCTVSDGLDVQNDVLVSVRHCVWCDRVETKPYGAGGRKPWKVQR